MKIRRNLFLRSSLGGLRPYLLDLLVVVAICVLMAAASTAVVVLLTQGDVVVYRSAATGRCVAVLDRHGKLRGSSPEDSCRRPLPATYDLYYVDDAVVEQLR